MDNNPSKSVERWFPSVYGELRGLAHHKLYQEARNATLNTTALVHEAYLKMARQMHDDQLTRNQFFGMAAQAMRRILVDYARAKLRQKRGGGQIMLTHQDQKMFTQTTPEEILALQETNGEITTWIQDVQQPVKVQLGHLVEYLLLMNSQIHMSGVLHQAVLILELGHIQNGVVITSVEKSCRFRERKETQ